MSDLEKAARLALDTLERTAIRLTQGDFVLPAIDALRVALAQQQAEPLQGGLTDREICAWKMGYDAAKAEQADPTEGNPSY